MPQDEQVPSLSDVHRWQFESAHGKHTGFVACETGAYPFPQSLTQPVPRRKKPWAHAWHEEEPVQREQPEGQSLHSMPEMSCTVPATKVLSGQDAMHAPL